MCNWISSAHAHVVIEKVGQGPSCARPGFDLEMQKDLLVDPELDLPGLQVALQRGQAKGTWRESDDANRARPKARRMRTTNSSPRPHRVAVTWTRWKRATGSGRPG